jgi:hypothetical protein
MMRALLRLAPLVSCLALVACGGGGSDSGGAIQPPQTVSVDVQPASTSLGVNSLTDVIVNVQRRGTGVADGTTVSLSVDQPALGQVGAASGENQSFNNAATATTSAGQARFRFKSTTATGTATIRASVNDPNTPAQNITDTATISLNGGPSNDNRLTLEVSRTTLPTNPDFIAPFIGSPYEVEVAITWRNLRGELVVPTEDDVEFGAAWQSPNQGVGAIGRNDDPETDDVNEYLLFFQSVGVPVNSGRGTVYVRSTPQAGDGRLTVSTVDPDTGESLSAVLEFTFSSGAPSLPGSVSIVPQGGATYVVGSAGSTSRQLQIFVDDGAGSPVPNPGAGGSAFNNVRLEIVDPQGERLSAVAAGGQNQEGTVVNTTTSNGVAGAVFFAADRQGSITVRATADRADNNVDNGITDPVVGETSIVVSDGRLFSVTLTTPVMESLVVNRPIIALPGDDEELPPPDGTYSLTVSALATDRLGNPALPNTQLQFGLIDAPLSGFPDQGSGNFDIRGGNGDPQEGGTLFTAPGAAFTTAGGGAGPGDTLVLFGKDVTGNADHEGSRIVESVTSPSSLVVQRRFNLNDTTGQSVNSGPVIPYVIGRATVGTIAATAATDINGVATVRLNYPVTQLGRPAIVWVQGNGPQVAGQAKSVGDVEYYRYAGLAPAILSAAPSSITANEQTQVLVCLQDARNESLQGATIGFAFEGLEAGTGRANGQTGSGTVGPTGADGCTTVTVSTTGIQAGQEDGPQLRFFYGGAEAIVDIVGGEEPIEPVETFTLTITIVGDGMVVGTGSAGGFSPQPPGGNGFTCTAAQSPCVIQNLVAGANVALQAVPDSGSSFTEWSQDCSGTNAGTNVTIANNQACTATFSTP